MAGQGNRDKVQKGGTLIGMTRERHTRERYPSAGGGGRRLDAMLRELADQAAGGNELLEELSAELYGAYDLLESRLDEPGQGMGILSDNISCLFGMPGTKDCKYCPESHDTMAPFRLAVPEKHLEEFPDAAREEVFSNGNNVPD